jgi:menaquinone-dependent protoporphyrinogen oxidase
MQVLVAYGSKRGGTAGVSDMIGEELTSAGVCADVMAARQVRSVDDFDAVVVAGALYASRWHRDARRFVKRFAPALRQRAVWFVSSGPLDDSATTKEIPPVKQVASGMAATFRRGLVTEDRKGGQALRPLRGGVP